MTKLAYLFLISSLLFCSIGYSQKYINGTILLNDTALVGAKLEIAEHQGRTDTTHEGGKFHFNWEGDDKDYIKSTQPITINVFYKGRLLERCPDINFNKNGDIKSIIRIKSAPKSEITVFFVKKTNNNDEIIQEIDSSEIEITSHNSKITAKSKIGSYRIEFDKIKAGDPFYLTVNNSLYKPLINKRHEFVNKKTYSVLLESKADSIAKNTNRQLQNYYNLKKTSFWQPLTNSNKPPKFIGGACFLSGMAMAIKFDGDYNHYKSEINPDGSSDLQKANEGLMNDYKRKRNLTLIGTPIISLGAVYLIDWIFPRKNKNTAFVTPVIKINNKNIVDNNDYLLGLKLNF